MENEILNSASKIVLILVAVSAIILTAIGKLDGKDFMILATMVFTYYFTIPSNPSLPGGIK